jgi:hypothetical protein
LFSAGLTSAAVTIYVTFYTVCHEASLNEHFEDQNESTPTFYTFHLGGHAVAQLVEALRYLKFAVSIPDSVIGIFL